MPLSLGSLQIMEHTGELLVIYTFGKSKMFDKKVAFMVMLWFGEYISSNLVLVIIYHYDEQ